MIGGFTRRNDCRGRHGPAAASLREGKYLAALEQAIEAEDGANALRFPGGQILGVDEIAGGNGMGDENHAILLGLR